MTNPVIDTGEFEGHKCWSVHQLTIEDPKNKSIAYPIYKVLIHRLDGRIGAKHYTNSLKSVIGLLNTTGMAESGVRGVYIKGSSDIGKPVVSMSDKHLVNHSRYRCLEENNPYHVWINGFRYAPTLI